MASDTLQLLFDKYGPTLTVVNLAECLHKKEGTVYNEIGSGKLPIATWREGGKRLCHTADVAKYIEMRADVANKEWEQLQSKLNA